MTDDRAVATTLNYVLSLTIATLLVTGLLLTGSSFVSDSRKTVIHNELSVIGEQIASDIERVDRLVVAGDGAITAELSQEFPTDVTGSTYGITLDGAADPSLRLRSTRPEVTIEITLATQTDLGDSHADGGAVLVRYDDVADELVIDDA